MTTQATARGLVFVTAHNAQDHVVACLRSLAQQRYQDFRVAMVDDASTDQTVALARECLQTYFPGRHDLVESPLRQGKAFHACQYLRHLSGFDFVAVVDGDDQLVDPLAFDALARAYDDGFDVVWSDFVTDAGQPGGNGPLDPFSSPRQQGWQSSHLFSFRNGLLDAVPDTYFQDEHGQWLDCACDMAIAYPVLDQTRRYLYVPQQFYRYTTNNPLSHHAGHGSLSSPRQRQRAAWVQSRDPLPCWRPVHEHAPSLHMGAGVKLQQLDVSVAHCFARLESLEQRLQQAPLNQLSIERLVKQEGVPVSWIRALGGWAVDPGLLDHLATVLDGYQAPRVLEFGSGRGSRVLARLVANRGGTLVSLEHDATWAADTARSYEQHGLGAHAQVLHAPLVPMTCLGLSGQFYDMSVLPSELKFDVVLVDGPPEATGPYGRLPALSAVASRLSLQGFHLLLDDYHREQERHIVRWWLEMAPELQATELSFDKQVCEIVPLRG